MFQRRINLSHGLLRVRTMLGRQLPSVTRLSGLLMGTLLLCGCVVPSQRFASSCYVDRSEVSNSTPDLRSEIGPDATDVAIFEQKESPGTLRQTGLIQEVEEQASPAEDSVEEISESLSPTTLTEMEQLALSLNPSIAIAQARVEGLRGKWVQVGLRPNPTVGYASSDVNVDGSAGMQGAYLNQKFIRGNKLEWNRTVVMQEIDQAEQAVALAEARVRTDVRLGFYDVLLAQRRVQVTKELVEVVNRSVQVSQRLLEVREIPRIGLLQAELEAEKVRILLQRAQNGHAAAWQRLAAVVGQADLQMVELNGDLDDAVRELEWQEQLSRLATNSPELAVAAAELSRAEQALNAAIVKGIPDLNLQFMLQHDDVSNDIVSAVQLGMPLPLWDWNQGGVRQAQGQIAEAQRNIERVELSLVNRLAAVFREYANARYAVAQYSKRIIPKAQKSNRLVNEGYEKGQVGYLDMLTSQRTLFQTKLAHLDALRDYWSAVLRIEGLLLKGSLKQ